MSAESGTVICDATNCSGSTVGSYVTEGGVISRANASGSNSQTRNTVTANGVIMSNV